MKGGVNNQHTDNFFLESFSIFLACKKKGAEGITSAPVPF